MSYIHTQEWQECFVVGGGWQFPSKAEKAWRVGPGNVRAHSCMGGCLGAVHWRRLAAETRFFRKLSPLDAGLAGILQSLLC